MSVKFSLLWLLVFCLQNGECCIHQAAPPLFLISWDVGALLAPVTSCLSPSKRCLIIDALSKKKNLVILCLLFCKRKPCCIFISKKLSLSEDLPIRICWFHPATPSLLLRRVFMLCLLQLLVACLQQQDPSKALPGHRENENLVILSLLFLNKGNVSPAGDRVIGGMLLVSFKFQPSAVVLIPC